MADPQQEAAHGEADRKPKTIHIDGIGDYPAPVAARGAGSFDLGRAQERTLDMFSNPEVWAGLASMVPGWGTGVAAAVGGGASLTRDAVTGRAFDDPYGTAARAGEHALINAIPGGVEAMLAKKTALPAVAAAAGDVAMQGTTAGRIMSALRGALSLGKEAAPAAAPALQAGGDLAGMEIGNGVKVLSKEGYETLLRKSVELENSPAANTIIGKQQIAKLDDIIRRTRDTLRSQGATPESILQGSGLNPSTAAARAAADSAAQDAARATRATSIAQKIRMALGISSEAKDYLQQ